MVEKFKMHSNVLSSSLLSTPSWFFFTEGKFNLQVKCPCIRTSSFSTLFLQLVKIVTVNLWGFPRFIISVEKNAVPIFVLGNEIETKAKNQLVRRNLIYCCILLLGNNTVILKGWPKWIGKCENLLTFRAGCWWKGIALLGKWMKKWVLGVKFVIRRCELWRIQIVTLVTQCVVLALE